MIKYVLDLIITPLTNLINCSIEAGIFPDCLKTSRVIPIFKKGDANNLGNYRPVAIVATFGKIFEKVLSLQLSDHLESNNLFSEVQYGFRSNKSTTMAINSLVSHITNGFETEEFVGVKFCDLSKAFDCLDRKLLLEKLNTLRFSICAQELVDDYLKDRHQVTDFKNDLSEAQKIPYGVPQGSILGPLLFLIYINDLPSALNCDSILYADDTSFLTSSKDIDKVREGLEAAQLLASTWFTANGLLLNPNKTTSMVFSTRKVDLVNPDSVTFLGVKLDRGLTWQHHIDDICSKLAKSIYLLRKITKKASLSIVKSVYFALFQGIYSYAILTWGYSTHTDRVFKLQRKAIRLILGLGFTADVRQGFIDLQILTVPAFFVYQCLIYVKSNINQYTFNREKCNYNMRDGENIYLTYCRIGKSRNSLNYHAPKFFNALPSGIAALPGPAFARTVKEKLLESPIYSVNDLTSVFN